MSHYTNQNPISEQAWMESVLSQLGGKPTQHSKPGELSELAEAISEINGILAKNNNNPPSDPAVLEDFAEKLDELSLMIYRLLEADEDDGSKDKKKQWPVYKIKIDKSNSVRLPSRLDKMPIPMLRKEIEKLKMRMLRDAENTDPRLRNKMQNDILGKNGRFLLNKWGNNYLQKVLDRRSERAPGAFDSTEPGLQKENFTGSKKPEKIEHGPCPDCGEDASFLYYGMDHMGNDDWVTDCSNPRCPSHDHHSKHTR